MQIPEIRFDCSVIREKLIFLCFAFMLVLKLGVVNMDQCVSV